MSCDAPEAHRQPAGGGGNTNRLAAKCSQLTHFQAPVIQLATLFSFGLLESDLHLQGSGSLARPLEKAAEWQAVVS